MESIAPSRIHENAWVAWLAARALHTSRMAVTLGSRIYLWNTDRATFLADEAWVRHELCHIRQFRRYGLLRFLFLYLVESICHGYRGNRFEQEARAQERQP